jgi:N-acyl-D-amino-acid deacylase
MSIFQYAPSVGAAGTAKQFGRETKMPEFDVLIRAGTIIDGLRSGRFVGDIGIRNGKVAAIGGGLVEDATRVLDARGLIVAPGFIDLHTHYDSQLFWDPWCTISGWHGVTSVAIGNCGFGFAPCKPADRERAMLAMTRNEAVPLKTMKAGLPWDWETFPEWLESLARTPKGVNVLTYVPLNPLFMYVMGPEEAKKRRPTADELAEMCRLLEVAMEAGACGFSLQKLGVNSHQRDYDGTPMITDTIAEEDLMAFARVLRKLGRGVIQGIGAPGKTWEMLAETSGRPVIYNTVSPMADQHGVSNGRAEDAISWIHECNARGNRVLGQATTIENDLQFTMEDWNLFDFSPVWRHATLGTPAERLAKLSDPEVRSAIKAEYDGGYTMPMAGPAGIRDIRVLWVEDMGLKDRDYEGRKIGEIADRDATHPIDVFLDIAVIDALRSGFGLETTPSEVRMSEAYNETLRLVANDPYCIPGISDGGAHTKFLTSGCYPTDYLIEFVRKRQLLDLEYAHWHLSTLAALSAGFADRGFLQVGMPADVVVYDFAALQLGPCERAHDYPADEWRLVQRAYGYRWILVNGVVTFEDDVCTGVTPGVLLRHGRATAVDEALKPEVAATSLASVELPTKLDTVSIISH